MEMNFWFWSFASVFLVLFAGLMSGLSLGLLSQDVMSLEAMSRVDSSESSSNSTTNSNKKQLYALNILPLVRNYHLLLVTLLVLNAAASETLPLCLEKLVHPAVTIIISVLGLLIFGEIIPQALCSRFALEIGSFLHFFVWILIGLCFPITFPIAKLLDYLFGQNSRYQFKTRSELKELVGIHQQTLTSDEILIIKGALDMQKKVAVNVMTPLSEVFMLNISQLVDDKTISEILQHGHSRIPIYSGNRTNIIGMLLVKSLIGYHSNENNKRIRDFKISHVPLILENAGLLDLLNMFQKGASHLAVVIKPNNTQLMFLLNQQNKTLSSFPEIETSIVDHNSINAIGIITLEDVIEELIGEEIIDETDEFVDIVKKIRVASRWKH